MHHSKKRQQPAWVIVCVALVSLLFGCQVLFGGVEVLDAPDTPLNVDTCQAGDSRCNGEFLLSCGSQNTGWTLKATCASGDRCDDKGKRCSSCKDGDLRCLGATRQKCKADGSDWENIPGGQCESAEACGEQGCDANCSPAGELQCSAKVGTSQVELRECVPGQGRIVLDTCLNETLCDSSIEMAMTDLAWSRKCDVPRCPEAGKYSCEGARLRRCPPSQENWEEVDTCASTALCDSAAGTANNATDPNMAAVMDMCKPDCPSAGAFFCEGMILKQCKEDLTGWNDISTCPEGTECNPTEGICGTPCIPGQFQCNGSKLRKCQPDQKFKDEKDCLVGALCEASMDKLSGQCLPPVCKKDEFRCTGTNLEKCKDDLSGWEMQKTCASSALCNALSTRCEEPICMTAGGHQCFGQELRRCSAGLDKWETVTTCAAGQFCDSDPASPGCKLECPRPTRCNGKTLERCTAQGWVVQANCASDDLCNCTLTDPDGAGPLTNSCLLGLWTDGCGVVVCGGSKATHQCQGAQLQKCQAGRNGWNDVDNCSAANLCYPGEAPYFSSGYCATCPTAGELACNGSAAGSPLRVCSADRRSWTTSQTCNTYGCVAVQNGQDYCANCNNGQTQCAGATLQRCASDRRSFATTNCASAGLCDDDNNQCDVCAENTTTCSGSVLQRCSSDGQSRQDQTCSNVCDAANGQCDSCAAGTAWCSNTTLNQCSSNGQTVSSTSCATSALCDATNRRCNTPTCAVGATRCDGAQPQICNTGRNGWTNTGSACATAGLCNSDATCTQPVCAAGARRCNGAQPQVCNANRSAWQNDGTACASAALCNSTTAMCGNPSCGVNEYRCSGAQPQVCNADRNGWNNDGTVCASVALCTSSATGAECGEPVCAANATRCMGAQPQVCSGDRTRWQNSGSACATTALCVAATASCTPPVCDAMETRCSGAQPQVCNSGRTGWSNDGEACASSALCTATGGCGTPVCDATDRRCNGVQPQVCNPGRSGWANDGAACATAGLCMGGSCMPEACIPGQERCNGAQPEVCNASQTGWTGDGSVCVSGPLCVANAAENDTRCSSPTCDMGERRCDDNQPQLCNGNRNGWTNSTACGMGAFCTGMGTCVEYTCDEDEPRCDPADLEQPQVCNGTRTGWTDREYTCATAALCIASCTTSSCCTTPTCAVGARNCSSEGWSQVCNAGQTGWTNVTNCGNPGCNATTGQCIAATCDDGDDRCEDDELQTCNDSQTGWSTVSACGGDTPVCDVAGVRCGCVPGDSMCMGTTASLLCDNQGHWGAEDTCEDGETCTEPTGACAPVEMEPAP